MKFLQLAVPGEASPTPAPTKYIDPSTVGPGFIGFALFLFLAVATFLLWRSMNKQLKRVDFEEEPPAEGTADRSTDGTGDDVLRLPTDTSAPGT